MGFIMAQIHKTRGIVGSILHAPITYHLSMGVKMKTNQINAAALANTAREVIAMCDNKKYTIAKIIAHWNLCVEQSGFTGTFDFPATGYIRKSALVDDFSRCAQQLDRIAADRDPLTGESIHAADPRCDDEGNDPREWCGNDIEAAHAEALEYNAMRHVSKMTMPAVMDAAHTKALDIDYCVEAVKEGGGYLGGYVVQNKDASFQILHKRTTTGNPLKATYFSEEDYQQGRMKQFCFNGEIPVRLGAAVLSVAELAK